MRESDYVSYFDQVAQMYAQEKVDNDLSNEILDNFLKEIKPNTQILDFGCGVGYDSEKIFKKGYKVIGLDLSSQMIEIAKKNIKGVEFVVGDFMNRQIKMEFFNGVWARRVFIHLPLGKWSRYLRKFNYILKKDGFIFINTIVGMDLTKILNEKVDGNNYKKIYTYVQPSNFINILEQEGFSVVNEGYETKDNEKWFWVIAKKVN